LVVTQGLLLINGIAAGSMILCYVAAREINEPHATGSAIGIVNMMTMLCGAIAQTAIGWLLDWVWSGRIENEVRAYDVADYHVAFLLVIFCGVAGVVLALTMRETCVNRAGCMP
jgi:sugar phosphate permease